MPDLSIHAIVRRYELTGLSWARILQNAYVGALHPWELPLLDVASAADGCVNMKRVESLVHAKL